MRKSHIPCPLLSLPIQGQHILYHNSSTLPKPLSQKPLNLPPSPLLPFEPKLPHPSTTTVYPSPSAHQTPSSSPAPQSPPRFFFSVARGRRPRRLSWVLKVLADWQLGWVMAWVMV